MSCSNSDILALIDYFENGTDLSNNKWDNYNYYDLWNALENGASPPSRTVCATFTQADILSVTLAVLGTFTTPSQYLGFNRDFYYLYLKAIGSEDPSPVFTNFCIGALYDVFTVDSFTGLLDDYPNAAAAYSIRLLKSDYTGPLVQIRKQGDNAINSFYPDSNNELSLNSTDISGTSLSSWIGSDNGFIRTWFDQSGNSGRDATQASAASQPQIINAGVLLTQNSKASLNFNGANNLAIGTTSTFNFLHDGTSSCAISVANLSTTSSLLGTAALSGALRGYSTRVRTSDTIQTIISTGSAFAVNNITDSASFTAGQLALIQDYVDADNATAADRSHIYIDNSSVYNNNTQTNSVSASNAAYSMKLGAFGDLSGYLNGYMSECIFYDSDQTSNKSGIQTNINDYFSIY